MLKIKTCLIVLVFNMLLLQAQSILETKCNNNKSEPEYFHCYSTDADNDNNYGRKFSTKAPYPSNTFTTELKNYHIPSNSIIYNF